MHDEETRRASRPCQQSLWMKTLIKPRDDCPHKYYWTTTKLGGFAQCEVCKWIFCDIIESECEGYISPEIIETERKAKRLKERETKRLATIEWLKNQPK